MNRLLLWKQFDLGLCCLSMPFWQAIASVRNFRTFTIMSSDSEVDNYVNIPFKVMWVL